MLYSFLHFLASPLFKILFNFKVYGRKNLPRRGGVIIAANHTSFTDPVFIGAAVPRKLRYLAKEGLFRVFLLKNLITRLGAFPIHRQGLSKETFKLCFEFLKNNLALLIFPEGGRKKSGLIHPGMLGIGLIAYKTKTNIVPCYLKGTDKVLPIGAKMIKLRPVQVIFGPPVLIEKFLSFPPGKKTYQLITDEVMLALKKLQQKAETMAKS